MERGEPPIRAVIPSTPPRTVDVRPQVRTPLRSPEQMEEQLIGASYSLPQLGGADVRACTGMADTVGSNGDEADLRRTVTFPELEIPTGQTWERNVAFHRWVAEVVIMCGNLSVGYGDFAFEAFSTEQEMYQWQRETHDGHAQICSPGSNF